MKLTLIKDGERIPYSVQQLRKDNPNVSFPRSLKGFDLTPFGVEVEDGEPVFMADPTVRQEFIEFKDSINQQMGVLSERQESFAHELTRTKESYGLGDIVPMYKFLYGLRQFGLRVQFELYVQQMQGHARDFWLTSAFVSRDSEYLSDVAADFGLNAKDLDFIFSEANSIGM